MQLTSWWSDNHKNLIVDGAYDSFSRPDKGPNAVNRQKPFGGSLDANFKTGLNIIDFSINRYGSLEKAAYHYGPGDPKDPTGYNAASRLKRQSYANDVMDNYNRSINFFHCFAKGVAFIGTFDN